MGVENDRQRGESQVSDTLVKLLSTPETHRQPEDVFEIANSLFRASFVQQLDICTRAKIAHCAKLYEIVPGALITFHEKGENALYIILSGSVRVEDAGLEFFSGDTFGFRPPASPTFQLMAGLRVVTCAKEGIAAKVDFDDCLKRCVTLFITPPHERVKNHLAPACYHHALIHCQPYGREKIWPEVRDDNGDNDELSDAQAQPPSSFRDMVWSPKLAESILLRGGAKGDEVPIALEFLNFRPVNGYSKELRKILVSEFIMLRAGRGHIFCKWFNALPINPSDVQLSRVSFDSVVIVISGSLVATCRRRGGDHQARHTSAGSDVHSVAISGDRAFLPKVWQKQEANTVDGDGVGPSKVKDNISKNTGEARGGQFVIMRLTAGDVFLPRSDHMHGGRQQRNDSVVDQQVA